jgi:hypothetical protein
MKSNLIRFLVSQLIGWAFRCPRASPAPLLEENSSRSRPLAFETGNGWNVTTGVVGVQSLALSKFDYTVQRMAHAQERPEAPRFCR